MTADVDVVGLSLELQALYRRVPWADAACVRSWLPTAAWMNEGWGHTPSLPVHSNEFTLVQQGIDLGLPVRAVTLLELAAMIHWVEIDNTPDLVGRRSPMMTLAKTVCQVCPIRARCLEWALVAWEPGIWGGTTERQRRAIRSARRQRHHRR